MAEILQVVDDGDGVDSACAVDVVCLDLQLDTWGGGDAAADVIGDCITFISKS